MVLASKPRCHVINAIVFFQICQLQSVMCFEGLARDVLLTLIY